MSALQKVILKPGREKALKNRHPWIFSGAIASFPTFENGDVLSVFSSAGDFLARAYFHKENSISGRVLTFLDEPVEAAIDQRLSQAIALRGKLFDPAITNCYRLINAEGDGISGLVVDLYDDIAVIQVSTYGIERLKPLIVEKLRSQLNVRCIFEKSQSSARRQEGLADSVGPLFGECPKEVLVKENGLSFLVAIEQGQKTGLFLDQREMRQLIGKLSRGKRSSTASPTPGDSPFLPCRGEPQQLPASIRAKRPAATPKRTPSSTTSRRRATRSSAQTSLLI